MSIVTVNLTIIVEFDKDSDVWVGWCPSLDLYSQGETQLEAHKATAAAVRMWLRHAEPRAIARKK